MCSDVTVVILDRPRHSDIIKQCRAAGARIRLISDGDVSAAIEVAQQGAPVDVMIGIGGTPEGINPWATPALMNCVLGTQGQRIRGKCRPSLMNGCTVGLPAIRAASMNGPSVI